MKYPTYTEIAKANRLQLCKWYRFLPPASSPAEKMLSDRITKRWKEVGGFTAAISKTIGWEK